MFKKYIFPDPRTAPDNAPLCMGADLSTQALMTAYKQGIFPWFVNKEPILWWSPNPRAVLFPKDVKIQKSTKPYLKKYEVKFDYNFANFINLCKKERQKESTWLSDDITRAFIRLSNLKIAHSVEVYEQGELIGGLYGLIIGKVFCGESMLSLKTNASKVALITLCKTLERYGFIIDCQIMNPHLEFMGAVNMPRDKFLDIFKNLSNQSCGFKEFGKIKPVINQNKIQL